MGGAYRPFVITVREGAGLPPADCADDCEGEGLFEALSDDCKGPISKLTCLARHVVQCVNKLGQA
jgi:hypothetical protein